MTKQRNIRISIIDLTRACIALGECHVAAAGHLYATLCCDDWESVADVLNKANIDWCFD